MKTGRLFQVAAFLAALSTGWGMEAPGARSPIGSPTQVPSANRTGAIASQPNLYGYVGHLTMTGQIGGGRHFRGFIPYSASDSIDRRLLDPQSRAISNFLRRSALAEPFYDPRQTAATLQRSGGSGLTAPVVAPQVRVNSSKQWLDSFDITELFRPPDQRPLSVSSQTLESILQQQLSPRAAVKKVFPTDPLQTVPAGMDLLKTSPETPSTPVLIEKTIPKSPSEEKTAPVSIYAQIRRQMGLVETTESPEKEGLVIEEEAPATKERVPEGPAYMRSKLVLRPEDFAERGEGRALLKEHADFEHLAAAKSEDYLRLGEEFLKSGQYYKAADAFELAGVWDRGNPLVVLARSHALFAAGEYMSSAFYLSQAIEMEPKLLESRFDWSSLLDSRDAFENRLTELSTWQQRSNSAELALLMGYILYQDGKIIRARISAEYAHDMMPDRPAAQALLKIIQSSAEPSAQP